MDDEVDGNVAEQEFIPPQTLKGLKRLAVKIKRRDGITHTQALEVAAQKMGYTSYIQARKALDQPEDEDE